MKTTIEIRSIFGDLIFSYESEENSILKTLEEAIKSGSNLRNSNLRNSDLSGSDLRNSDLRNSDLSGSNLRNSDLRNSDLSGSNLRNSDLSTTKNKEEAYLPIFCKWTNCIHGDSIRIGCKEKTIEEWDQFFASEEEYSTRRGTPEFKQIQAVYESLKAYVLFLNS